ncbi:allophanate hydrolase [Kitasatospora cheerisanensis KCTC 2395]|uniref:Allophanate hydrolase n=1 Tax=Kitasatospora cheerisanensis KCTC 2395 TaxID=1348663 RepID=A0A066YTV1_9ACTN|nr:allophanate hydrolase [Kitasatospora cheerisanensis KCTC 2395]
MTRGELLVVRAGFGATVQDLGRPGLAALGVGRAGAADREALRLANRLVGNPEDAAGIEAPMGGVELAFPRTTTCALAGADCPPGSTPAPPAPAPRCASPPAPGCASAPPPAACASTSPSAAAWTSPRCSAPAPPTPSPASAPAG